MAAVVSLLGTATFNTTSGSKTVTATPAVGDLIVIVVAHSGSTTSVAPTDNNSGGGGTYTLVNTAVKATSADTMQIWVRNNLITSATSTVFTQAPGTTTGGGLVVVDVQGMGKVGSASFRQSAIQSNQASGGTPAPVLGTTPRSYNPIIGAVFNASNPATLTPRTNYTEIADLGYNTPATGLEVMYRNSGETSATITWGSTSGSAFASIAVELDSTILHIANGALNGTGTASFVGSRKQTAAANISGAGTLAASALLVKFASTNLNAAGSTSFLGNLKKLADSSFTGTGSLTSLGSRTTFGSSNLNAVGTISSIGIRKQQALSNFTGTGTLVTSPRVVKFVNTSLNSAGTLAGISEVKKIVNANLTSSSSISSSYIWTQNYNGYRDTEDDNQRITEAGVFRVTEGFVEGLASLSAVGTLSADGTYIQGNQTYFGLADFTATGSVTAFGIRKVPGVGSYSGIGSLVSVSSIAFSGSSSFTGNATIASVGRTLKLGTSTLTATGTLSADAKRTTYAFVSASITGTKLSVAERRVFGTVDLHGVHTGAFTPSLILKPTTAATSVGTLNSISTYTASGSSNLTGVGSLTSIGLKIKLVDASLNASGSLTATAFDSTMYVKNEFIWKVAVPYVKHNNTWKRPLAIYKNVNGVWTRAN